MDKLEVRVIDSSFSFDDEGMTVEGLVNRTESWSHTLGMRKKFREKISKGAFARALVDANRVDFLAEHDDTKLLSTTENGSLELWEDEEGLKMRANICPTTYGKDMYELIRSKIVNHMSFGFRIKSDKWKKLNDGTFERVVDALELMEVSVVRNPAYPQSAIASRGIELVEDVEIPQDIIEDDERRGIDMNDTLIAEISKIVESMEVQIASLKELIVNTDKTQEAQDNVDTQEDPKDEPVKDEDSTTETTETVETDKEETQEDSTEETPKDETTETDEVNEDEGRSFDLTAYKSRLKERR